MAHTRLKIQDWEIKGARRAGEVRRHQAGRTREDILMEIDNNAKLRLKRGSIAVRDVYGISGVYFLFRGVECVYIGESACVFTRIAEHLRSNKDFDSFRFERVDGERNRKEYEKKLIKKHHPLLNFQHNLSLGKSLAP